ncbi:MAG: hypothetical protein ACT4OS_02695 [Acidimicrobiales bacterium]
MSLGPDEGLADGSFASFDNTQLIGVDCLIHRAGNVDEARWPEFCTAMLAVMGCRRGQF